MGGRIGLVEKRNREQLVRPNIDPVAKYNLQLPISWEPFATEDVHMRAGIVTQSALLLFGRLYNSISSSTECHFR